MWVWNPNEERGKSDPGEPVVASDDPALEQPFMRELVRQIRALDTFGAWEHYDDAKIIDPYILTPERKRALPITADPDAETVTRVRTFYNAAAARIEAETGRIGVPVINISHEGFGRAFILVGRLVSVDKPLRDIHRFGFPSAHQLVQRGERLVAGAVSWIERFPDAAG